MKYGALTYRFSGLFMVLVVLYLLPSTTLCGQAISQDAKAVVMWMDAYTNLPITPSQDELPKYTPGWFEEVEIRSETDEFMLNRQRYTLRGDPKMPHVRKAERRVQNAQRAGITGLSEEALSDGRADALAQLFELATDLREAKLIDTLFHVQSRLVDLTRLRVLEPGYDVEKVLDAEDDLALVALDSEGPSTTVNQVAAIEKIDAEIALERAENLAFLKFLQVEHRRSPDPDDLTRELWSVGGSIAFPRRERHIRQLDELKVKRIEEEFELELKKSEREREFKDAVLNLRLIFESYDELKAQLVVRRARRDRLGQTYLQSSIARPEALLRLSRRNLNDRLDLLQLEEDIREGYAALLGDFKTLDAQDIQRWVLR